MPLQDTYLEWLESPYNTDNPTTTTTCQDCHMTPGATAASKPNPGRSADELYEKEHIYTHAFQGSNVAIPTMSGSEAMANANRASLQGAATLTIALLSQPEAGQPLAFAVEVTNVGAGHHLPTGVGELRQMWLDVSVTDSRGGEVYRSGAIGEDGVLDPDAYLFNLVLAGPDGTPILMPLAKSKCPPRP